MRASFPSVLSPFSRYCLMAARASDRTSLIINPPRCFWFWFRWFALSTFLSFGLCVFVWRENRSRRLRVRAFQLFERLAAQVVLNMAQPDFERLTGAVVGV